MDMQFKVTEKGPEADVVSVMIVREKPVVNVDLMHAIKYIL